MRVRVPGIVPGKRYEISGWIRGDKLLHIATAEGGTLKGARVRYRWTKSGDNDYDHKSWLVEGNIMGTFDYRHISRIVQAPSEDIDELMLVLINYSPCDPNQPEAADLPEDLECSRDGVAYWDDWSIREVLDLD